MTSDMEKAAASAKTRIFFPNLDGLRFLSFFVVFLYHCYMSFFAYLRDSSPGFFKATEFLFRHGSLGVNFFFVLSGFLITYLLIREKELAGKINIRNFYLRRILRIWPLYYACLLLGFVVFPLLKQMGGEASTEIANPYSYMIFGANFDFMNMWPARPEALSLSVLWSVAVEEQFYLTWPLVLAALPIRRYKFVFPAIMLFSLVFRSLFTGCDDREFGIRYFHTFSLIGDMALGGLFAYLCSYESKFKLFITNMHRLFIIGIYIGTMLVSLFTDILFPCGIPVIFERLVIGVFFGLIILEQNYAKNSFFKLGRIGFLSKLGIYTYGLYCLHLPAMFVAVKMVGFLGLNQEQTWVAVFSVVVSLVVSIVISILSYHLFEKWFLRIKSRYSVIVTK